METRDRCDRLTGAPGFGTILHVERTEEKGEGVMNFKSIAVAALIAAMGVAYASADWETLAVIDGELTQDSPIGHDQWGDFHYELIQFTVNQTGGYYRFTMSSDDFEPYFGIFGPPGDYYNPDDFYDPAPLFFGDVDPVYAVLFADSPYDLVLTTWNYDPTPLGSFSMLVEGNGPGLEFTIIPEPGTSAMLGLGLLGLLGLHRRRARSDA
jgi:hypothetical protein